MLLWFDDAVKYTELVMRTKQFMWYEEYEVMKVMKMYDPHKIWVMEGEVEERAYLSRGPHKTKQQRSGG